MTAFRRAAQSAGIDPAAPAVALPALAALAVVAALASLAIGPVAIAPGEVIAILCDAAGLGDGTADARNAAIVLSIRLPRTLLAALVGAGLAVAGALMQGLFRNPLADPGIVGVSAGAALGAVAAIVLGGAATAGALASFAPWLLPAAAFAGGLAAALAVHRIGRRAGRTLVATMLLAGIAINALCWAGTGLLIFASDDRQLRDITFWTMGSVGGATWPMLAAAGPPLVALLLAAPWAARALNAYMLGEREAGHLGVDVERLKRIAVVMVALLVGICVAASGIVSFVGLVVPHLLRLAIGADHRTVLPGAALLGATLLLAADIAARTVAAPAELPIGLVTSTIGGPFFLWLLMRDRDRGVIA